MEICAIKGGGGHAYWQMPFQISIFLTLPEAELNPWVRCSFCNVFLHELQIFEYFKYTSHFRDNYTDTTLINELSIAMDTLSRFGKDRALLRTTEVTPRN